MKKKILLIGWADRITEKMLTHELKQLAEKYEILFADKFSSALAEINKAKSQGKTINTLIFQRSASIVSPTMCKIVLSAAKVVSVKSVVVINVLTDENDKDGKRDAIGIRFCNEGDWEKLEKMLDENV